MLSLLGETLGLEAVSPSKVILRPPEKLILQVRATGRYNFIEWSVNGGQPVLNPERFTDFGEVYVRDTTASDLGLYEVGLALLPGQASPTEVDFFVIEPGM